MAASARANCSATPERQKVQGNTFSVVFFLLFSPRRRRETEQVPEMWVTVLGCCEGYWFLQTETNWREATPRVTRASLDLRSPRLVFSLIELICVTHLRQKELPWSHPSFGSRIVRPPSAQPPSLPSLHLLYPSCPHLCWPRCLPPNPSTQLGERLAPGPSPWAWWYAPLSWPPDLNEGEIRRDTSW